MTALVLGDGDTLVRVPLSEAIKLAEEKYGTEVPEHPPPTKILKKSLKPEYQRRSRQKKRQEAGQ